MSIAPQATKSQAFPSIEARTYPPQARVNRRDFANTLDSTQMILRAIGFPLKRRQNIVSAIQGKAGGRLAFSMAHLTLARSMQHAGSDEAARAYVRRELDALDAFQRRTGYLLFNINRGGGADHERTSYEDLLTPAALWAVEAARNDREAWAAHPGKALAARIPEAVARLHKFEPEIVKLPEPKPETACVRIARNRTHAISRTRAALELVKENGGDVVVFAMNLAREIVERAHLVAGVEMDESWTDDFEAVAELLHLSSPPSSSTDDASAAMPEFEPTRDIESTAGVCANAFMEQGGLQICHPESEKSQQNSPFRAQIVDVALAYASGGWHVFPLHTPNGDGRCSCAKAENCKSIGKHPRTVRGVKEATIDLALIAEWWNKWPDANVGIATGARSGIVVLDIDPRHAGDASLAELIENYDEWPETAEAATGGGGWHVLFQHPGIAFKNSASVLGNGLDVKTDGGYIVAAPSLHASGRRYEWRVETKPAAMPDWLIELLTTPRQGDECGTDRVQRRSFESGEGLHSLITEGSRNELLFRRVACRMRGQGASRSEIEQACLEANARLCVPPLPEDEVLKLAASATRYAAGMKAEFSVA